MVVEKGVYELVTNRMEKVVRDRGCRCLCHGSSEEKYLLKALETKEHLDVHVEVKGGGGGKRKMRSAGGEEGGGGGGGGGTKIQ